MKIPKKYKSPGFCVFCNSCKRTVNDGVCKAKNNNCTLIYQSRIWNPKTKRIGTVKSWTGLSVKEAFYAHLDLRKELEENNHFYQPAAKEKIDKVLTLKDAALKYLDYLADIGVPDHEKRNRSKRHIKDQNTYINRFLSVMKSKGSKPTNCHPQISSEAVGWFHEWLEKEMEYANKTYNHHITAIRVMFNWLVENEVVDFNPFSKVKLKATSTDPKIVLEEELSKLISVVTHENGWKKKGEERRNMYRDWVVPGIKLTLYTGERGDGVSLLKWKNVEENYIVIPNWKRNRQKGVNDYSYVPITPDVATFLLELGYRQDPDSFLIAPEIPNREYVKDFLSSSFSHYWKLGNFPEMKTIKGLRKTFETRLFMLLGDKAKGLKRHKSMSVKIDHYLSQKEIMKELANKNMFHF